MTNMTMEERTRTTATADAGTDVQDGNLLVIGRRGDVVIYGGSAVDILQEAGDDVRQSWYITDGHDSPDGLTVVFVSGKLYFNTAALTVGQMEGLMELTARACDPEEPADSFELAEEAEKIAGLQGFSAVLRAGRWKRNRSTMGEARPDDCKTLYRAICSLRSADQFQLVAYMIQGAYQADQKQAGHAGGRRS